MSQKTDWQLIKHTWGKSALKSCQDRRLHHVQTYQKQASAWSSGSEPRTHHKERQPQPQHQQTNPPLYIEEERTEGEAKKHWDIFIVFNFFLWESYCQNILSKEFEEKKLEDRMWTMLECFEQMSKIVREWGRCCGRLAGVGGGAFITKELTGSLLLCYHIFSVGHLATCHCLAENKSFVANLRWWNMQIILCAAHTKVYVIPIAFNVKVSSSEGWCLLLLGNEKGKKLFFPLNH